MSTKTMFALLLLPSIVFSAAPQPTATKKSKAVTSKSSCAKKTKKKSCNSCPLAQKQPAKTKEFEATLLPVATATVATDLKTTATQTAIAVTESTVSTTAQVQSTTNADAKKRSVTVVADMPKASLGYKHFFGTYYPTEFYLTVNGKKSGPEETVTIDCENNCVDITYYAQFQNGRETSRQYVYAIDPKKEQVTATFGWKVDNRVMLDDERAQLTSFVEIIP
ncbi:MAG TPA: hypothetical protein VGT41_03905 [Candidatus Babeliales bacterium]|nr:hypothetical protein [Candidatus Babeliales bacterium]